MIENACSLLQLRAMKDLVSDAKQGDHLVFYSTSVLLSKQKLLVSSSMLMNTQSVDMPLSGPARLAGNTMVWIQVSLSLVEIPPSPKLINDLSREVFWPVDVDIRDPEHDIKNVILDDVKRPITH